MEELSEPGIVAPAGGHHVNKKEIMFGIAALLLFGGFLYFFYSGTNGLLGTREYGSVYTLVPDKVSRSAAIVVALPKGVSVSLAEAGQKITFDPVIPGVWSEGRVKGELLFRPNESLIAGSYYSIILTADPMRLEKDFLADEDPVVEAVFPNEGTETSEYSDITIIFNRPMVPLTTLDELAGPEIPVTITPETHGKFKWITTRNLQFIPDGRLMRSATYIISIKDGFTSLDGLAVPPFTHTFTTRPLRYEGEIHHGGVTLYHEPVVIRFNQPVDLERTKGYITVDAMRGDASFIAEYGTRSVYNESLKKDETFTDKSVIRVFSAQDRHGREKFWDFNSSYSVTIARAVPLEGDSEIRELRTVSISVPEVIRGLSAESPRTKYASPDFFDPEGVLWVSFYEDIDKDRLSLKTDAIQDVRYGEKCKDGDNAYYGRECEKVPDHTKIGITFKDPGHFKRSQDIILRFVRIVNTEGIVLNAEDIVKTVRTYPALRITRIVPADGAGGGKLTELKICATTPLTPAAEENFLAKVRSNISVGAWNWYEPYRVTPENKNSPCMAGEFENTIHWGLIPEAYYSLALALSDDFGQAVEEKLAFTSEKIPNMYRRFYHLQKGYNVTSPERMKLTYAVENLEYVNLHVCEVDAKTFLRYAADRIDGAIAGESLSCIRTVSDTIQLPGAFWRKNHFQVNIGDYFANPLGYYVLTFSHPDYRVQLRNGRGGQLYERTLLNVTRMAVQEKKIEWDGENGYYDADPTTEMVTRKGVGASGGNLYWVSEFGTLNPVVGARVEIVKEKKGAIASLGAPVFTGADGIARSATVADAGAAIVSKGGDSTIVSSALDKFQWASPAYSAERAYIYTDRPIYRPGHEVHLKGITRIGYDGNYEIFRDKKAHVEVRNSKGENAFTGDLDVSEYGTFVANFFLDAQAPLGTYSISVPGGWGYFDVEEYVPAAFNVGLRSDKKELIAGDTLSVDIDARYYFGVPLEGGEVEYSILAQDYYFDRYQDEYFQFGSRWYYRYDGGYGDTFLSRGKATLDANGRARIEEKADFEKLFREESRGRSKIFIVNATVKNTAGQSISAQTSVIVHRGEHYVGVSMRDAYAGVGEQNSFRVKTVDTTGAPLTQNGIAVEMNRITWDYFKRKEVDGRFYYQSEKKKERVREWTVGTDGSGNASRDFSVTKEGEYELTVRSRDSRGNEVVAAQEFYVFGPGIVDVRPTNNEALDLAVQKSDVRVGEDVTIIIKSPYPKAKALVTVERGKIFEYRIIDIERSLTDVSVRIKEEYIPDVYVSVLLLSPRPEVKYGQIHFVVNTHEKELTIEVKPSKNNYLPGEEVRLEVFTKDSANNRIPAEVSLSVADVSVLALKGNPKKNPVLFFYGGYPLFVTTASNIKNILYEAEIPLGTKGGGAGAEPEDLAKKKRGVFKDTAFWEGTVRTGQDGRAIVTFTLPDNLTTWQVEAVGVTKDTKIGAGYGEFVARKDLMVVPLKPRFIIPGDEFMIGAQVFNETDVLQKIEVALGADTLERVGATTESLALKPHESDIRYFAVRAPKSPEGGEHRFVLSARAGAYEDTVESVIPVKPNDTYESVATANYTARGSAEEYLFLPDAIVPDKGGVTIQTSATLAIFLSDALNYLVSFPYGCTEQIASKLSSLAVVKRGLNIKHIGDAFSLKDVEFEGQRYSLDDVVAIGLARIYAGQTPSGGFSYYRWLTPNFYLTLHVVDALEDIRQAGYAIDIGARDRAARFLYQQVMGDPDLSKDRDALLITAYALSRLDGLAMENGVLRRRVEDIARDEKFIHEDISNISLAKLAILSTKGYTSGLREDLFRTLENRVSIDSRGAHLATPADRWIYDYYETPVKDTALLLKAFAAGRRDNPIIDKVLRWLLKSRAKDGAWGSTNNTLAAVDALTDYLGWRRETESDFSLDLLLDDTRRASFDFNPSSILNTFEAVIPTSDISIGALHVLKFVKTARNALSNAFYYDMALKYYLPVDKVAPRDEGFTVRREFFKADDTDSKEPLSAANVGDVLKVHLTISTPKDRNFVAIEDFIPAGTEIVNTNLATEDQTKKDTTNDSEFYNGDYYDEGIGVSGSNGTALSFVLKNHLFTSVFRALGFLGFDILGRQDLDDDYYAPKTRHGRFSPSAEEAHDDRLFLFRERLPKGVYEFDYYVRALIPGTYHHLPAVASELYFPENFGRTGGEYFVITK